MAPGFDSRRQTMDVDALIKEGHGPVVEAVRRIGRGRGWPDGWLNEEAVSAIPRGKDGRANENAVGRNGEWDSSSLVWFPPPVGPRSLRAGASIPGMRPATTVAVVHPEPGKRTLRHSEGGSPGTC